jgi:dCMP deaminase
MNCDARQFSDQLVCRECDLTWDVNDEAPPRCKPKTQQKRPTMPWPSYYMALAGVAKLKSKDPTQVGAILVGQDGEVRLTAFNGPPRGVKDLDERFVRPVKYLFASHAEQNLIAFAAREGIQTNGCAIYVTHLPCSSCARSIIQAGVTTVVYGDGKTSMPEDEFLASQDMFKEAGVTCINLDQALSDAVFEKIRTP